MELPKHLRQLYRHWDFHLYQSTGPVKNNPNKNDKDSDLSLLANTGLFGEMSEFVDERMSIWKKKTLGESPPYTADPILGTYRFCNVFREFDRQTIEFHELLNPLRGDFSLWLLNMFYCRMVARTETVRDAGLLSYDPAQNEIAFQKISSMPRPRYGTPYVFPVSVILKSPTPTRELFIARYLPIIMKSVAEEISGWHKQSVYDGAQKVVRIFGYNLNFLWTEVLIDVAYQFPERVNLFAKFPIGPGSAPTMQRIGSEWSALSTAAQGPGDLRLSPRMDADSYASLAARLADIHFDVGLTLNGRKLRLSAENWEGIGCEFRKYTNLKSGKGRKRLFKSLKR